MNKVIMMGRLTRDPEMRYSQGENAVAVARFSIAVDRRFRREGESNVDFFNCTAFGKQAGFVEKYLRKGIRIVLCGHLQNNNYTNKEGQLVYSIQVMVDEIEFAESKSKEEKGRADAAHGNVAANGYNAGGFNGDGFMNIPDGVDEELPFN